MPMTIQLELDDESAIIYNKMSSEEQRHAQLVLSMFLRSSHNQGIEHTDRKARNATNVYAKEFVPEDVSNWLSKSPIEFMMQMSAAIYDKTATIEQITLNIANNPLINEITAFDWSNTRFKEVLNLLLDETYMISRLLKTAMMYREAYLRGEVEGE